MTEINQTEERLDEESPKDQYLIFSVEDEAFGIDINYVIEIIGMETISEVPDVEEYIKGVINLRGKIIPVMDVRLKLHKPSKEYNDRTCIIVVAINGVYVGLIIDEVLEVIHIAPENIMPPPKSGKEKDNISSRYVRGIARINDMVRLLIDGEKLLDKTE